MLLEGLVLGLLAVAPVFADRCDVYIDGIVLPELEFEQLMRRADAPPPPTLDLYVHVVAGSENREDGYLTEDEVNGQVQLIKDLYAPTGITFNHNSDMTQWYVNSSWAGESTDFDDMKKALHEGNYTTINLYIRNITVKDYGGTCTNPWSARTRTPDKGERLELDGCVIATNTLPGSSHEYMNEGKTAVHEIGHWFGLWHTFEHGGIRNGVSPPNPCWEGNPDDNVTDTPKMQRQGTGTCVETQNSCKEADDEDPIYDPIHNYMSYSSDSCMTEFTRGQV
ncbi:Extracellular metalloprotease 1 [Madurella mycetomatis]|uniref:Extracellular metalloprotease 1 n=1 Tax=Madurella mycetomatis TaxID=100816 RepID=A0A175VZA2_9PEZI|nr:Extracellular metalloprotease 1 [Madurella mycetomatis]KXX80931.1 Extracellular metalloprotease 1 [Madurella mycetomatis]